LTMESGIDSRRLRHGDMTDAEWEKMIKSAGVIAQSKLIIDDMFYIDIESLCEKCRKLALEKKLDIIIIDYLQLMGYDKVWKVSHSRQQVVNEIVRLLKELAEELDVPIVVLSQLPHSIEMREDKHPVLSDLLFFSAIEQKADVVMMLYRDEYYNKNSEKKGIAEVLIEKNERGMCGTAELKFICDRIRFANLDHLDGTVEASAGEEFNETAERLQSALKSLDVGVSVTDIICGPSITRYELTPDAGVRVSSILKLSDDIKRILGVEEIRIEAPISGKTAVGIEVPNKERSIVTLREMLDSSEFKTHKSNLAFAVGKDIYGQNVIGDIAKMPHLLIAGTEGSGKTVFLNSIIVSLIYHKAPTDVKLLLIDPNIIELKPFNGIPHLIKPVITTIKHACEALAWAVTEMTNRYKLFAENKVMNHSGYNEKVSNAPGGLKPLPQIVIIVSELADLMLSAPTDVEDRIQHIAQMGRAAGIHLILATQHPTPKVLTGSVKANMPSRIALNVASSVYSRNIIDMAGAEKLLGNGDMLYYPVGAHSPVRLQGPLVTEKEIEEIVEHLKDR